MHELAPPSSRSPLAWLPAVLALALPACGPRGPVMLDELEDPVLSVSWYQGSFGEPLAASHFYVQLSPRQERPEDCLELDPAIHVTVGDDVLSVISLGGWVMEPDGLQRCTIPTFVLPGEQVSAHPLEATTAIELSDGTATLGVVARGLFVERGAELEAPAGGSLVVGEPAVVAWRPSTDRLDLVAVFFYPDPPPSRPSFTLSGDDLELDGSRIGFRVPQVEPGRGMLRVEASAAVPTEACRGLARCDVAVLAVIRELAVELRPS